MIFHSKLFSRNDFDNLYKTLIFTLGFSSLFFDLRDETDNCLDLLLPLARLIVKEEQMPSRKINLENFSPHPSINGIMKHNYGGV